MTVRVPRPRSPLIHARLHTPFAVRDRAGGRCGPVALWVSLRVQRVPRSRTVPVRSPRVAHTQRVPYSRDSSP
eukprot:6933646-Prymnesium_polylepis.2